MGMEISGVLALLDKFDSHSLIRDLEDVPCQNRRCKLLANCIKSLVSLLKEMKARQTQLFLSTMEAFLALEPALVDARRWVEKVQQYGNLRLLFLHAPLSQEFRKISSQILESLHSLPMDQLQTSTQMEEEIRKFKSNVEKLLEELKDISDDKHKEMQNFLAKLSGVLRSHNLGGAMPGGGRVVDQVLKWLADQFRADVEIMLSEWDNIKEEICGRRTPIEYTTETKRLPEYDFLLQAMVFIDLQQPNGADPVDPASTSSEFTCPICHDQLKDPVVNESGSTFCKSCITKWYAKKDMCPLTQKPTKKILIDNIALRNHMERCLRTSETAASTPSGVSLPPASPEHYQPPVSLPSKGSSVRTLISDLKSNLSMKVLQSLKDLETIAGGSEGKVQIYESAGIPALAELLKSEDVQCMEKAAVVLEALTFERKDEELVPEFREKVWGAVVDDCLDPLISLMQSGTKIARLKAAETVVHLLEDGDIRGQINLCNGVVSAFNGLTNIEDGFIFTNVRNEGKDLCIRGLSLLSGEKPTVSMDDVALVTALLQLTASRIGSTSTVAEESLLALSVLVEMGGQTIRNILCGRPKAMQYLARWISRPLSEKGKVELLKILYCMSSAEGMAAAIMEWGLVNNLLPSLTNEFAGDDFIEHSIKLLSTCLLKHGVRLEPTLFLSGMRGFVNILSRQTSEQCKENLLLILEHLCQNDEALKKSFLSIGGMAALRDLTKSSSDEKTRERVAILVRILCAIPDCHEDMGREDTMELLYLLLSVGSQCRGHALVAAESLIKSKGWPMAFKDLSLDRIVDSLRPTNPTESREAAIGILSVVTLKNHPQIEWNRASMEFLLDVIRKCPHTARVKAAELLMAIVKHNKKLCFVFVEEDVLSLFKEMNEGLGKEFRRRYVQLLTILCRQDDDCREAVVSVEGVETLLDVLERGRMKNDVANGLKYLVNSLPSRAAVVKCGFIDKAAACIHMFPTSQCSFELLEALSTLLESRAIAGELRKAEGVQALIRVLRSKDIEGKKLSATVLAKLMRLDPESAMFFEQEEGIYLLMDLLSLQMAQPSEIFADVQVLEALQAAAQYPNNKMQIYEHGRISELLRLLTQEAAVPRVQELVLEILLELSRGNDKKSLKPDLCLVLQNSGIVKPLIAVVNRRTNFCNRSVENAIRIIRNISINSVSFRRMLLDEGVLNLLLERINHHEGPADIVQLAVVALERFMYESRGRVGIIEAGGISPIVSVVKHPIGLSDQGRGFAIKILVTVVSDHEHSKSVCDSIFKEGIIPGLRDILEFGPSWECKTEALVLLKYLITSGPQAAVCKAIRAEKCIPMLLELRKLNSSCEKPVNETLDLLKKHDRECKKLINELDNYSMIRALKPQA